MRLTELDPVWLKTPGRAGLGITFDCPYCRKFPLTVLFLNPLDGGPSMPDDPNTVGNNAGRRWARSGMDFESLSIHPSIDQPHKGHTCHVTVLHGEVS